jgi:olefin beta-lactone synthetase
VNATGIVNIAACLSEMAEAHPDAVAICQPIGVSADGTVTYQRVTYRELNVQSDLVARGLTALGIGQGVRAVLMVPPGPQFFVLTFGMAKAGVVPVMVDPGLPLPHLKQCLAEAEPEAFIGSPKAHFARLLFGWARGHVRTSLVVGGPGWLAGPSGFDWKALLDAGDGNKRPAIASTSAEDMAAIVFTSGSTGVPKGVVYTHAQFAAQVAMIKQMSGVQPGEVDLPTFPLFALFDPALGMTTVVPQMDFKKPASADPGRLLQAIESQGVTNMFASPALMATLGRWGAPKKLRLTTLRRIVSAGAPVPPRVVQQMVDMMPDGGRVFTPYGATEALPVCGITSDAILQQAHRTDEGAGICVGRPVDGVQVRIIPIRDEAIAAWHEDLVLPVGATGEITVKGPQVTRSYWRRDEATSLAKISDGDGFWHRMGDVGYFDARGSLWFCGRKSHRVVIDGERTLFTIPCEGVFNAHPAVLRSALVGVRSERGLHPVLCVELEPGQSGTAQIVAELRTLGRRYPHTAGIAKFLFHPGFPVDIRHNAKIGREQLALWAQERWVPQS